MRAGTSSDPFTTSYEGDPLMGHRKVLKERILEEMNAPPPEEPVTDPPPVVTMLYPGQAKVPSASVDVRGSGFTERCVVIFQDMEVMTTFVSNGKLTAILSASLPGTYDVKVRGDGGVSNSKPFTFNP